MATLEKKDASAARPPASVELDDAIFGIEPNVPVMHQVVTAQLAARRSGTQSTKTRAEVRGGGAKPWQAEGHRPGPRRLDPLAASGPAVAWSTARSPAATPSAPPRR